jgi:putative oxidoreductase
VQRLFSTFPEGWPGAGLIFLRAVTTLPLQHGIRFLLTAHQPAAVIPQMTAAAAGVLLVAGLCTPIAGLLMAASELFLAFSSAADPSMHVMLGALGAALAMLGPGAWSVDARLFGRKRIEIPQRKELASDTSKEAPPGRTI